MSIVLNILSEFDGKGINKAKQQLKQLETTAQKAQYVMKQFGGPAAIASFGFLTAQLGFAVKAAAEDQKSQEQLKIALENTVGANKLQVAAVEDSITALMFQTATADDELRPALSALVRATGDVTKAQTLLKLSTDVAAGSGKDLGTVSNALAKAAMGQFGALRKLGIPLDETAVKTKNLDVVVGDLSRSFGGAASKNAQTFEGQVKTLKLGFGELQEAVGNKVIPLLSNYASVLVELTTKTNGAQSSTKTWLSRLFSVGTWLTTYLSPLAALIPTIKAVNNVVTDEANSIKQLQQVTSNVTKVFKPLGVAVEATGKAHVDTSTKAKKLADALALAKAKAEAARQKFEDLGNAVKAKLGDEISQATTKLEGLQSQFDSFAGTVKSAILSGFSFGSAQSEASANTVDMKNALDKQAEAQLKVNDANAKYQGFQDRDNLDALVLTQRDLATAINEVAAAAAKPMTFFDNLAKQSQKAKDFGVLVNRLVAAGLTDAALSQVLAAGVDAGSAIATEILGSADGVLKANTLTKDLSDLADTIAQNSASHYYAAGVEAASSFLQGLNDTMKTVNITFADPKQTATDAAAANYLNPSPLGGAGFGYMGTLMAKGGIVTRPTTIMAGEAGPEAIIPLSKMGSMAGMGGMNITVNAGLVSTPDQIGQEIIQAIQKAQRRSGQVFANATGVTA